MADLYRSYIVRVRRAAQPGGRVWVQVEDLLQGVRRDVTGPPAGELSDGLKRVVDGGGDGAAPTADAHSGATPTAALDPGGRREGGGA
ncbi:MAG TPA: hypothetical protein VK831_02465 [Candidatus Deferrimicrobiaceae bacterium]|nr:hypothetical protein [Candidatus Deferrimicrobiaceae bacterium]